ncbi:E3 ubiquitin-protein ligase LUL3 [Actinidia chinensis var. chinensis]|uniref:E3 ubiquitin-protein ligase LUL3 n=1 Tax=Actinidia chinensis var. chinensis TaxID=1590841 RepID=A0A2R6R3C1_ACTCC|nr:E3 ubiquitin-protein ligase LUL3 [Actinidia chinensis var. chinensis]
MVLGPSSSRLFQASSVFIKQVEVKDHDKKGVFLYGFSEKPELSLEKNWSVSNYVIVASYSKKGFSLWLNKGSKIRIRWEAQTSSLGQLEVSIIKGERNYETLIPKSTILSHSNVHHEPTDGREAEYVIEEDDKYNLGIVNTNPRSIIMAMNGDLGEWNVELSFVSRVVTYIAILGFIVIIIFLILKYLGACDGDTREEITVVRQVTESDPLVPEKPFRLPYGTGEEDVESESSSSSEDLYDGKICVICYEEPRNCFFVPCGHCATCYTCAQRIMDGEPKVCPICRRLIHKVRKLLIP